MNAYRSFIDITADIIDMQLRSDMQVVLFCCRSANILLFYSMVEFLLRLYLFFCFLIFCFVSFLFFVCNTYSLNI